MATQQPTAAVNAVMAEAKLLGFVIDKQMVAVGAPGEFKVLDEEEVVLERLRQRVGSRFADRFVGFLADLRREAADGEGDTIEGDSDA